MKREVYWLAGIIAALAVGALMVFMPEALTLTVYILIGVLSGGIATAITFFRHK